MTLNARPIFYSISSDHFICICTSMHSKYVDAATVYVMLPSGKADKFIIGVAWKDNLDIRFH